jgi:hypothetical protein
VIETVPTVSPVKSTPATVMVVVGVQSVGVGGNRT